MTVGEAVIKRLQYSGPPLSLNLTKWRFLSVFAVSQIVAYHLKACIQVEECWVNLGFIPGRLLHCGRSALVTQTTGQWWDVPDWLIHHCAEAIIFSLNLEKAPWCKRVFEWLTRSTKRWLRKMIGQATLVWWNSHHKSWSWSHIELTSLIHYKWRYSEFLYTC